MIRYFVPTMLLIAAMGCGAYYPQDRGAGGKSGGRPSGTPPAMDSAQRLEQTMQALTKRLKLTPEQAEKVRAIIKAGEDKKEEMRPEGGRYDSPEEMKRFFERLHRVDKETEEALSKVLTESQLKEYKEYLAEQRYRMGGDRSSGGEPEVRSRGGGKGGGGRGGF